MFFTSKSENPIGLDISDLSLKMVQLKNKGEKIKIQAIGGIHLPKGTIENGEIKKADDMISAINKILSEPKFGKFSSNEIVACLPENRTFIKLIQAGSNTDIPSFVPDEIEKHIPASADELYLDWQIIERSMQNSLVLVGAAPKTIVDQYSLLFEHMKYSILAFEIEPVAMCRSLLLEENPKFRGELNKNYVILDIGARRTNLTLYSKDTILFSISIPISGNEITNLIAERLEISHEQAEKAKIVCGLDESKAQGVIKSILSDMIASLSAKIRESIDYYNNHFSDRGPINKIILSGGGANIKNLNNILKEQTLIETVIGDPLVNINEKREFFDGVFSETHLIQGPKNKNKPIDIQGEVEQGNETSYTTSIGLALREIFNKDL